MNAAGLPSCEGRAGLVLPAGTRALRDILRGGDDVLGSRSSKEAFKPPAGTLFSILCPSLPSPSRLLLFLRLALTRVPCPHHPPWAQPLSGDGFLQTQGCAWRGSGAEYSLPGEDERFPSLWSPRTTPWWQFRGEFGDWGSCGDGGV